MRTTAKPMNWPMFGATIEAKAQCCRASVFMYSDERGLTTRVCLTHVASLSAFQQLTSWFSCGNNKKIRDSEKSQAHVENVCNEAADDVDDAQIVYDVTAPSETGWRFVSKNTALSAC